MRLTRDTLVKIARDTAAQRARVSRRIICIYMTGSVLGETPLLGGTTDIDLVIVHDGEPLQEREIVRLTDEIHLDIAHYPQSLFQQPRRLRTHPWFGPFIYSKPMVFHDTQHWFDYTQASTGAQFFQPDMIAQRAGVLAESARQSWMDLTLNPSRPHHERVYTYFQTLENAGNALVCLTGEGSPLTERRFLTQLPQRLQALRQPDLISGLIGLLVRDAAGMEEQWPAWKQGWNEAYKAASSQPEVPPRLHPSRHLYYERAADALWEENPDAALWLLMRTWTLAAGQLSENQADMQPWAQAVQFIGLGAEQFESRLQDLDRYLDRIEEALEAWSRENGVNTYPES